MASHSDGRRRLSTAAVFDFGSNSLKFARFLLAENGRLACLDSQRAMIAVGDDVFRYGEIGEAKARELESEIVRLRQRVQPGDALAAAATSSYRTARNGAEMAERFARAAGMPVRVLSGDEEAMMLAAGVLAEWNGDDEAAVLDIGGGSAEIVRARAGEPWQAVSLPLGAIRLCEDHNPPPDDEPCDPAALESMRRTIDRALEGVLPLAPGSVCFGSGGGFSTLGQMAAGAGDGRNLAISLARIEALAGQLSGMSAMQCARRFGIPPRRARIMPAGAWTAVAALRRLGADSVTISWAGLREALALEALGRPLRSFTLPRRTLADRI